ncbi:MAG: hypothetical protein KGS47_15405 [Chloroflexi bacterium]|nr:hypothetical protein [Chloroflexota bacterium]
MQTQLQAISVGQPQASLVTALRHIHTPLTVFAYDDASQVYQRISLTMPEIVFLPAASGNTALLRLYRQLQRVERVCTVLVFERELIAYRGRGHRWTRRAPLTAAGLQGILEWCNRSQRGPVVAEQPRGLAQVAAIAS